MDSTNKTIAQGLQEALELNLGNNIATKTHHTEPVPIAKHDQSPTYVADVDDYELMQQRIAIPEGVAKGERAILENRILTHQHAKAKLSKWLK